MGLNETAWVVNFVAVPLWVILWWSLGGFKSSKSTPWLWLPFALAIVYLLANGTLGLFYTALETPPMRKADLGLLTPELDSESTPAPPRLLWRRLSTD